MEGRKAIWREKQEAKGECLGMPFWEEEGGTCRNVTCSEDAFATACTPQTWPRWRQGGWAVPTTWGSLLGQAASPPPQQRWSAWDAAHACGDLLDLDEPIVAGRLQGLLSCYHSSEMMCELQFSKSTYGMGYGWPYELLWHHGGRQHIHECLCDGLGCHSEKMERMFSAFSLARSIQTLSGILPWLHCVWCRELNIDVIVASKFNKLSLTVTVWCAILVMIPVHQL